MPNVAPEPGALTNESVARFREGVAKLTGEEHSDIRFGIAVSGGPDSMALLALASAAFPGRVEAATVDHQLRAGSVQEANMVADYCARGHIPHRILRPAVPIVGNLQSAARAARYVLLDQWRQECKIDWIMTAHHADDQLETLLMRLNRGSGVGGLASIRARNGNVLRPLLGWRRAELAQIVDVLALPHATDPSNSDLRFDRVAMRQNLGGIDWIDPVAAGRSASALKEADIALDWAVRGIARDHIVHADDGAVILGCTDLPREIQRRLILLMLRSVDDPANPRGDTLDKAIVQISRGKQTSIGNWILSGGEKWTLRRAPPRSTG
ncbi:MAG: tRNA lysidine(34) synthetase TilS [Sphingobium sp.]